MLQYRGLIQFCLVFSKPGYMCLMCINLFGHFLRNEKNRYEINAPGNDYRDIFCKLKDSKTQTGILLPQKQKQSYNYSTVAQLSQLLTFCLYYGHS